MAVHARIETPGGALPVFTTHLTYRPGLSRVRMAQASALARFVTQHAADCAYPPVVTGDRTRVGVGEQRLQPLDHSPSRPGPGWCGTGWAERG